VLNRRLRGRAARAALGANAAHTGHLEHEKPLFEVDHRRADERVAALEDVEEAVVRQAMTVALSCEGTRSVCATSVLTSKTLKPSYAAISSWHGPGRCALNSARSNVSVSVTSER
jgi:hypothetical protein